MPIMRAINVAHNAASAVGWAQAGNLSNTAETEQDAETRVLLVLPPGQLRPYDLDFFALIQAAAAALYAARESCASVRSLSCCARVAPITKTTRSHAAARIDSAAIPRSATNGSTCCVRIGAVVCWSAVSTMALRVRRFSIAFMTSLRSRARAAEFGASAPSQRQSYPT